MIIPCEYISITPSDNVYSTFVNCRKENGEMITFNIENGKKEQ